MTLLPADLLTRLLAFRTEREWEQFHTPQNLAIALSVEASELLECFQWMKQGETRPTEATRDALELEVADLIILLSYFCHDLGIDVQAAVERKLAINEMRYSVEKSKGNATKYDQFDDALRDQS
jgi:dCTP diphosphatase